MHQFPVSLCCVLLAVCGAARAGSGGGPGGFADFLGFANLADLDVASSAAAALSADRCNDTAPCNATLGEVCATTPLGNRCRRQQLVPCRQDADCGSDYGCFTVSGAVVGFCGGCTSDSDCATGSRTTCYRVNVTSPSVFGRTVSVTPRFGHCSECSTDADCDTATQYCDVPALRGTSSAGGAISGIFSFMDRFPSFRGGRRTLTFSCAGKLGEGERCVRDQQCLNGSCSRGGFRRFFRRVCN